MLFSAKLKHRESKVYRNAAAAWGADFESNPGVPRFADKRNLGEGLRKNVGA